MNSAPKYTLNQKPKRSSKALRLLILVAVLVLAGVVTALELTNTTHWFHHKQAKPVAQVTGGPATKVANDPNSQDSDSSATGSTTGDSKDQQAGETDNPKYSYSQSNAKLTAPRGPFVSNHRPNLDGDPAPNTINSVCNTTSGATCQIIFTKDGVTKKLPAQTTDAGGATYWNDWELQDIGLTPGDWKITAKATLGSQTKTSEDALTLQVME